MATNLSANLSKTVVILLLMCLSACQHYCLNNFVQDDCDARVKALRAQIAELGKENRRLRLYSNSTKCDDVSTYHH